jgi:hypothetical protein
MSAPGSTATRSASTSAPDAGQVARSVARAATFVADRGDPGQRRLSAVLAGAAPPSAVVSALSDAPEPRGPEASVAVLSTLADVGALRTPLVEAVVARLTSEQGAEGFLEASGSEHERIFATGMLGGLLARTPFARPTTLERAGDALAARFSPDRVQGFAWPAIAAYGHFFANVLHDASDAILQWCGRELERGFRTGHFDAVRTARVFLYCDVGGLPGGALGTPELLTALLAEQQKDGGWLALASPAPSARVAHTLDALAALVRLPAGRAGGPGC